MARIRVLTGPARRDPRETLDVLIGCVGFFAAAFVVVTAACELTGRQAVGWALTVLTLAVPLASLIAARRRLTARMRTGA